MPSIAYVADNIDALPTTPFDGLVMRPLDSDFHKGANNAPIAFDQRAWTEEHVALGDARRLELGELSDSYLYLQASTLDPSETDPAGWFDDERWKIIARNLELYARVAAEGGMRGIFFDEEPYVADPWTYDEKIYPGRTREEVQRAVRERGAAFMRSLQAGHPDLELVMMFGLCVHAVAPSRDSLVPSFYDGMLDVIERGTTIVDGNENAYYNVLPEENEVFRAAQFEASDLLAPEHRERYLEHLGTGHGFYTDLLTHPETFSQEYFLGRLPRFVVPEHRAVFTEWIIYELARSSTSVVWVWTEEHDWWRPRGERTTRAKRGRPTSVATGIERARDHVRTGTRPERPTAVINAAKAALQEFLGTRESSGNGRD